ncbi:MAG: hypothetical protein GXX96_34055 [Planctomycetaceae bacterium]|nr:hypothetical protein [Planctomycetaceae bacterium]
MRSHAKTNRRGFPGRSAGIASAALAIPYAVPGSALGKDGQTAPSERIILGSTGVGSMGRGDMKVASWGSSFDDCQFAGATIDRLFQDVRDVALSADTVTFVVLTGKVHAGETRHIR